MRCIVGRLRLDSGEISVLGAEPGKKGHGIPGNFNNKDKLIFKIIILNLE